MGVAALPVGVVAGKKGLLWAAANPVAAEEILRTSIEVATDAELGPSANDLIPPGTGRAAKQAAGELGEVVEEAFSSGGRGADVSTSLAQGAIKNPYKNLTVRPLKKSERSLRTQVGAHRKKLADYQANPDAFDHKGLLKNASPELRNEIINGRIDALQKQINKQLQELEKVISTLEGKTR